jgi:hypothetical protein
VDSSSFAQKGLEFEVGTKKILLAVGEEISPASDAL